MKEGTEIYYTYATKEELLAIGVEESTIFEDISQWSEIMDHQDVDQLNQAEMTDEQLKKLIPEGPYCYTRVTDEHSKYDGFFRTKRCPFWTKIFDFPKQNNGYCHVMKKGDWQGGMGLLWDQCKCCGINDEDEYEGHN